MAQELGEGEACVRYRSLVRVLIEQLIGLTNTDVHFIVSPVDGVEAVKFWGLPLFEKGHFITQGNNKYLFTPESSAEPLTIYFSGRQNNGTEEEIQHRLSSSPIYQKIGFMGTNCLDCGARWINMAMAMCKDATLIGHDDKKSVYLSIFPKKNNSSQSKLPNLPKIITANDWDHCLTSPIGGKLSKKYKSEKTNVL